jgi:hypothetical protein
MLLRESYRKNTWGITLRNIALLTQMYPSYLFLKQLLSVLWIEYRFLESWIRRPEDPTQWQEYIVTHRQLWTRYRDLWECFGQQSSVELALLYMRTSNPAIAALRAMHALFDDAFFEGPIAPESLTLLQYLGNLTMAMNSRNVYVNRDGYDKRFLDIEDWLKGGSKISLRVMWLRDPSLTREEDREVARSPSKLTAHQGSILLYKQDALVFHQDITNYCYLLPQRVWYDRLVLEVQILSREANPADEKLEIGSLLMPWLTKQFPLPVQTIPSPHRQPDRVDYQRAEQTPNDPRLALRAIGLEDLPLVSAEKRSVVSGPPAPVYAPVRAPFRTASGTTRTTPPLGVSMTSMRTPRTAAPAKTPARATSRWR